MYKKQKWQKPRLDRRNANRNIDYDASNSPSSSSFDGQSSHRSRSLDLSTPSDRTSFRVEGIDGEFDRICRSLGLSGPEDFSIPVAAWEARKTSYPSNHLPSSRFSSHYNSEKFVAKESPKDVLSDNFRARARVSDEVKQEEGESGQLNIVASSINVRCARDGGYGIRGVRPPVLAPPPAMSRSEVDNVSSTWDIFRSFGPEGEEDLGSPIRVGLISSLVEVEETEEVVGEIIGKQDSMGALSESCSDTSNGDNDDDSFSMTMEPVYDLSVNGKFRHSMKSWQKGDFLGSGSFGTVYEGFTDDGFFFAVKEVSLLDQGSQGKQSIYQLEQEISLLSQFEHENIVRYLGTDKDDGKLYIFLELVTKGSLARLYQKYNLRDSQVSAYTRQILNGLNYLHSRDVVHRDIKCANILVDVSGSVKLADFGLAKATKLNDVKSCKGTAFWMAPEVVKSRGYGLAADIWSLGCTVLEMLTRQIPYSHLEGMQALFRIGKGEPPPMPDSLSGDAQEFILKCLQVNPDDRPTAAQLLDHPFVKKPSSSFFVPASPHYFGTRDHKIF